MGHVQGNDRDMGSPRLQRQWSRRVLYICTGYTQKKDGRGSGTTGHTYRATFGANPFSSRRRRCGIADAAQGSTGVTTVVLVSPVRGTAGVLFRVDLYTQYALMCKQDVTGSNPVSRGFSLLAAAPRPFE